LINLKHFCSYSKTIVTHAIKSAFCLLFKRYLTDEVLNLIRQ